MKKLPKQETIEEVALNIFPNSAIQRKAFYRGYNHAVKTHYSEEEVLSMLDKYDTQFKIDTFAYTKAPSFTIKEWFNQNKKK